jgi:hypothetical protein
MNNDTIELGISIVIQTMVDDGLIQYPETGIKREEFPITLFVDEEINTYLVNVVFYSDEEFEFSYKRYSGTLELAMRALRNIN